MIDFNALVAPINDSTNTKTARSAVWAVLRTVKAEHWNAPAQDLLNIFAAVDAAAWVAGVSQAFRSDALNTATGALGAEFYSVVPTYLEPLCLA